MMFEQTDCPLYGANTSGFPSAMVIEMHSQCFWLCRPAVTRYSGKHPCMLRRKLNEVYYTERASNPLLLEGQVRCADKPRP